MNRPAPAAPVRKAEIGGGHVGGAVGQQARRGRPEGLALGQFGLDGVNGAVAGTDEQIGHAIAGEFIEKPGSCSNRSSTRMDRGAAFQLIGKARPLPLDLPEMGLIKAGALHGMVIQEVSGPVRRAAKAWSNCST